MWFFQFMFVSSSNPKNLVLFTPVNSLFMCGIWKRSVWRLLLVNLMMAPEPVQKISPPPPRFNPWTVQLVASRSADWTIPTHNVDTVRFFNRSPEQGSSNGYPGSCKLSKQLSCHTWLGNKRKICMFNVLYLSHSANWSILSESTNRMWFVVDRNVIVHIASRHSLAGNLSTHHMYTPYELPILFTYVFAI